MYGLKAEIIFIGSSPEFTPFINMTAVDFDIVLVLVFLLTSKISGNGKKSVSVNLSLLAKSKPHLAVVILWLLAIVLSLRWIALI